LLVQNQGFKTFAGTLGALNTHNEKHRIINIGGIKKQADGYWEVTDSTALSSKPLVLDRAFTSEGVTAMKNLAKLMAKSMPVSH